MLKPRSKLRDTGAIHLAPIGDDPRHQAAVAELKALEDRLAETDARRKRAKAVNAGRRATPSAATTLSWAAALVKGGAVPSTDPDAEIAACDQEFQILMSAIQPAIEKVREIENLLSYEACKLFQDAHFAALGEVSVALSALAGSIAATHEIRATLLTAGYAVSSTILPMPVPQAAYVLGSPANCGSQAHKFVRSLQELEKRQ
jgi:hypothetical protein